MLIAFPYPVSASAKTGDELLPLSSRCIPPSWSWSCRILIWCGLEGKGKNAPPYVGYGVGGTGVGIVVAGVTGTGRADVAAGVGEEGENTGDGVGTEGGRDRGGLVGTSITKGVRGADVTAEGTGTTILTGRGAAGGRENDAGVVIVGDEIDGVCDT